MARTIVYIDGFNLYYGALKRTPFKWLDLGALCTTLLPQDDIIAINYYTALVSARPGNPTAPNDQQIYLRALRTIPKLSITLGHFLTHSVQMPLSGSAPRQRVWVDKTEEKGSDVNRGYPESTSGPQRAAEGASHVPQTHSPVTLDRESVSERPE